MAFIVETIVGDKRIQLGNEDFVRTMALGTNWQKIRIGLRISIYDCGGNIPVPEGTRNGLTLGVCQGSTYAYSSPNCVDALGLRIPDTHDAAAFTRGSGPPVYYGCAFVCGVTKVGQSEARTGSTNINTYLSGDPGSIRSSLLLDITRGAVSYTLKPWNYQNATQVDMTRGTFLMQVENEATPGSLAGTAFAVPYTGSGLFDSVFLHWGRCVPTIEISDLTVVRFY